MNATIANSIKFWTEFLELYESLPALWKMKSEEYGNRILKAEAYNKMVEKLKEVEPAACRDMVVRKINTFRTNYRRDLRKVKTSKISGAGVIFKSSLWYFDILSFLDDPVEDPLDGHISSDEYKSLNLKLESSTNSIILPKKKKILKKVLKHRNDKILKKRRYDPNDMSESNDNLSKIAGEQQREDNDEAITFAKAWATQYAQLSKKQKLFTRKIFSDVLFHSCLNHLTENTVQEINKVLDTPPNWSNDSDRESRMTIDTANE